MAIAHAEDVKPSFGPDDQSWSVQIGQQVYGPYSTQKMRGFIEEGRVVAQSLVALHGGKAFAPAASVAEFAGAFVAKSPAAPDPAPTPTRPAKKPEAGIANFVVILEDKGRADVDNVILNLGRAYKLSRTVWLISTTYSAAAIRNHLTQYLGRADRLFIVDATRDKLAWYNYGTDADARIRSVWHRADPVGDI